MTAEVAFVDGTGTLQVAVANDGDANGPDAVAITLTSAAGGGETFAIDATQASASGTVTEDEDDDVDPADIDGDGFGNAVDAAAYDATNGAPGSALYALAKGGEIAFDFDTPTSNVFDGSTGLTGVMVTPSVTPPPSASDPYGTLTNEATTAVTADGYLSVDTSGPDTFATGVNATTNAGQDLYQAVLDVTGSDKVRFETKIKNPFDVEPTQFVSLGLTIGSGDQDNFVKFVFGGNGGTGANGATRLQIGHNNSLQTSATNTGNLADQNLTLAQIFPTLSAVPGLTDLNGSGGLDYNDLLSFIDTVVFAL